jgi:hypothetical protein
MKQWEGLKSERTTSFIILICIGLALLLKLVNVFNAPAHWDTGLYLNIAVGYVERGILTPLMWRFNPEWNIVTGSGSGYGVLLLIGWIKLFGISILSGHLLMYIVGILNLPIIYVLGKRFYNNAQAGWWAVVFFALSGTFAQDFYARMDAPNLLICSLVLLLHLEAIRRNKWWLYFAVGVALIIALEVHVLAAFYAGGIGLYHAAHYLQSMWKAKWLIMWSPAIAFGIGLLLAAAIYYVVHIAPNPDIYFEIPRHCLICTDRSVAKELYRWFYYAQDQFPPLMLLCGFAVISAFMRRTQKDQHYLLLMGGAIVAMWALNPPIHAHYTGQLLTLLALGVGGLFGQGLDGKRSGLRGLAIVGSLVLFGTLLARVSGTFFTPTNAYNGIDAVQYPANSVMSKADYISAIDYVRATIPTDAIILAPEPFFGDLINYTQFMSYYGGEMHGVRIRGETLFDLWEREQPQVFIGDPKPDAELWRYMGDGSSFVEVHPKVWVAKPLVAHLALESP